MAANCWHMNDQESAAMWKLYLKSNEGIAIQSNYTRLSNSFDATKLPFYIGKVKHIDYYKGIIGFGNLIEQYLRKRMHRISDQ